MAVALGYTWSPVMIAPPDATPPSEAVVAPLAHAPPRHAICV